MIAALVRKELRELLPFIALVLAIDGFLYSRAAGVRLGILSDLLRAGGPSRSIPFLGEQLWPTFVAAGLLAVVVGLWQTMRESSRGTFQFLLHRPIRRDGIITSKLLVGGTIYLLAASLPVLLYALWAATPGTHASPFFWSMTTTDWIVCVGIPLLYLGAFLSGLRPARIYGSRFLPLAGSLLLLLFLTTLASGWPAFRVVAIPFMLLIDACFVAAIVSVARSRDYS